jgi:hypothetical protein
MRERTVQATDADGRPITVTLYTPETPEDVEILRRRATEEDLDDRTSMADGATRRGTR